MVYKITGVGQTPMSQNPQNPVKKNNKNIEIFNETTVQYVKDNGSAAQKLVAETFDKNPDGKYDIEEAKLFNKFNFSLDKDKKELTATKYGKDNTPINITIKYQNEEDISKYAYLIRDSEWLKNGNVCYDITNKTITYGNCKLPQINISDGEFNNVILNDCSFNTINCKSLSGELTMNNCKLFGTLGKIIINLIDSPKAKTPSDNDTINVNYYSTKLDRSS